LPDESGPFFVDLFSGCGGFSAGLEMAGFRSILGLDIHKFAIETYACNNPRAVTILGDIRSVEDGMLLEALGDKRVSLVTAGVPCQGFSLCNRKRHDDDERNFLFREFLRVAKLVKPEAILLENVSGITRAGNGSFKEAILAEMNDMGFKASWRLLNAADYGVPQLRNRVFFVGTKPGTEFKWPTPTHGGNRKPYVTVWEAIGDLPPLEVCESSDSYASPPQNEYQSMLRGDCEVLLNHEAPNHPPETVEMIARTKPGEPMYPRFKQRIRLHPARPSPTQVSGGIRPQFQFGHPTQPRGLTVRERCRIQSFPDHYYITGGIVQGRVQTGNAVPPLLARAIGLEIKRSITGREENAAGIKKSKRQKKFDDFLAKN
jgi:DNA (cytosine-5)-methyltransferase 1